MPRLGIPANIERVSATFRQPGDRLNPLGLRWNVVFTVVAERSKLGSRLFGAYWMEGTRLVNSGLSKRALIPLLLTVREWFHEQVTPWRAYRSDGAEEICIGAEIEKQIAEYYRRQKRKRVRRRTRGNGRQRWLAAS